MKNQKLMSKTRIESFSDGVFSIILTLLVFNFKVPQLSGPDFNNELYSKLFDMYPYCLTYILSFILISMFWIAHHKLFHSLTNSDNYLLWINNLFLLFLAFIPFPTQVLGSYPTTESAVIFFGVCMLFTSLSFSLLRYYAFFIGKLSDDSTTENYRRNSIAKGLTGAAMYAVAIGFSAYSPDITLGMYALIPFVFLIPIHVRVKKVLKKVYKK